MTALVKGVLVGVQNIKHKYGGRPIYEIVMAGQLQRVTVTLTEDNSVVGANLHPFVSQREKDDLARSRWAPKR